MQESARPQPQDFYQLTPEAQSDLLQRLARKALQHYHIDDNAVIQLLIHRENAVFSITAAEAKYAMRIHRHGYHSDAELKWELHWMEALKEYGIQTPSIIRGKDGQTMYVVSMEGVPEPRQVDVLEWIDGSPPAPENIVESFRTLGVLNAKMHLHVERDWVLPAGFTRHSWDEHGLMGPDAHDGHFADLQQLTEEQLKLLHQAHNLAVSKLQAYGKGKDRYGLIHADMMLENILVEGDEVRLIDFDDAGFGWFMHDFGTSLFFQLTEDHYNDLYQAWLDGYQTMRPLKTEDIAMVPTFLMCRGLFGLGWMHTRRETSFAQEIVGDFIAMTMHIAQDYVASDGAVVKPIQ